jgi:hypothetical protein
MIEAGRYKARGVEGALGMTGTGKEQIAVLLEIVEGPHAGEQITWYGYFTEKNVERTMESLRLLGWSTDDLSDLSGLDANEVSIVIELDDDQDGQPRARVKWINGPGGLAMKEPMNEGAARAFAQRMKGFAVASRSGRKPAPARPRNAPPAEENPFPPGGDDILF